MLSLPFVGMTVCSHHDVSKRIEQFSTKESGLIDIGQRQIDQGFVDFRQKLDKFVKQFWTV
jgi:hypothetical protein